MRKKMGKFPFYSLISRRENTFVYIIFTEFYSEQSVKGTWIPESTFFIYLFLKNWETLPHFFLLLLKRWVCTQGLQQHFVSNEPLSNLHCKWLPSFLQNVQNVQSSSSFTVSATVNELIPLLKLFWAHRKTFSMRKSNINMENFFAGNDKIDQIVSSLFK